MLLRVISSVIGLILLLVLLITISSALAPIGIVIEPFWIVLFSIVIIVAIIASIASLFH